MFAFTFPLSPFRTPPCYPCVLPRQLNLLLCCLRNPKGRLEVGSVWFCQTFAKCARTRRNTFLLEGKQLSLLFLMQIRGSPGEVKASICLLPWHFCVGAIHSQEPSTKIWMLPPVLSTSSRDCSNTEVLSKELVLVCTSPGQHLLHHQPRGELLSLSKQRHPHPLSGAHLQYLDTSSKTLSRDLFSENRKLLVVYPFLGNPVVASFSFRWPAPGKDKEE